MLKVACVVDKVDTALDRLGKSVAPYHTNLDYEVFDVHPKRPSPEQLQRFIEFAKDADVIDYQYFRTAKILELNFPWLRDKKRILTHNNPYSIEEDNWNEFDINVGNNQYIYKRLGELTQTRTEYIPITVDTDFWQFNPDAEPQRAVIMVANRIESKKGILEVAIACGELGIKFILVGAISDQGYFHSIMQTGNVEFHEHIPDEELRELYYKSSIHVCNSKDNFESGTMPILESMLCGVPVLTRKVGHVPDISNGENMVINEGSNEDVIAIRDLLHEMISDKKRLEQLRQAGWNTAKSRSHERRAYMYQKLYRDVMWGEQTSVSVVVPVFNKPEVIKECLNSIANQTYKNLEVIIMNDNTYDHSLLVDTFARYVNFPVRYMQNADPRNDYGLARARNEGTIEATGELMVYCDQRIIMEPNAIEEFVKYAKPKYWLYGNKGSKKEFVENLSCIYRQDILNAGGFNERINLYGGQSQELRTRVRRQGYTTEFVETAKGVQRGKSSNKNRKRQEIIKMKSRLWKMGMET